MTEAGKTIIITGAAIGIGYAFAEHLAQQGHRIVITDLQGAEDAAARLRAAGHQTLGLTADVVSEADAARMAQASIDQFGGIDALVFTGGIGEHDAAVRAAIGGRLACLGIVLDEDLNRQGCSVISSRASHASVRVIACQEDEQIARHTRALS